MRTVLFSVAVVVFACGARAQDSPPEGEPLREADPCTACINDTCDQLIRNCILQACGSSVCGVRTVRVAPRRMASATPTSAPAPARARRQLPMRY